MTTERPTPELPDAGADQRTVLGHVRKADVVFLAWLDAWIDKSIRDGSLTPAKASKYREAIAARCVQLGEVPNIVGAVQRLDIKPGDTLVFVAPTNNVEVVHRMHEQVRAHLDGTGVHAIAVAPGTEIKVVHPWPAAFEHGPDWPKPGTPEYDAMQARWEAAIGDGVMTRGQALAVIREDERREELWRKAHGAGM
jgi:hypothetical protein